MEKSSKEKKTIKCGCNGGNLDCYKCDGWGYIEEGVREKPVDSAQKPPVKKYTEMGQPVKCRVCKKLVHSSLYIDHVRKCKKLARLKKIEAGTFVPCPKCNRVIDAKWLELHMQFYCKKRK